MLAQTRKGAERAVALRQRPPAAMPPAVATAYAGVYQSDILKDATVSPDGEALRLDLAATGSAWRLRPWNGDTFVVEPKDATYADSFATGEPQFALFRRDPSGQAIEMRFDGAPELVLKRKD